MFPYQRIICPTEAGLLGMLGTGEKIVERTDQNRRKILVEEQLQEVNGA